MAHPYKAAARKSRSAKVKKFADGGGIDDSIDLSGPGEGPYSLGQTMQYERAVKDSDEVSQGKRFSDNGSRIPGRQKAKNDAYDAKMKRNR